MSSGWLPKHRQLLFQIFEEGPNGSPTKKNSAARVEFDKLLNEDNLRIEAELELATFGG